MSKGQGALGRENGGVCLLWRRRGRVAAVHLRWGCGEHRQESGSLLVVVLLARLSRSEAPTHEGGMSGCDSSNCEGPCSFIRAGVGTEGAGGEIGDKVDVDAVRAAVAAQPFPAHSLPSLRSSLMQHAFACTTSATFTHCASSPPHISHTRTPPQAEALATSLPMPAT